MDYETKDSGDRIEYKTGMKRDLSNTKARFDLLIPKEQRYEQQMLTKLA
jgi:hypothetical protein